MPTLQHVAGLRLVCLVGVGDCQRHLCRRAARLQMQDLLEGGDGGRVVLVLGLRRPQEMPRLNTLLQDRCFMLHNPLWMRNMSVSD